MASNFDPIELGTFIETLRAYEFVSGLVEHKLTHDEHSLWIEWGYSDGSWAGTTSYDLPLVAAVEKLERELAYEEEVVRAGHPRLANRYVENFDVAIVENVEFFAEELFAKVS
jgi:hypothetical protein